MRVLIQAGWVVGFEGRSHRLYRDGTVVYEDDRVLHVGPPFHGQVDRTIDAHVMNLRRKLDPDRASPSPIETVFGVGYRFRSGDA